MAAVVVVADTSSSSTINKAADANNKAAQLDLLDTPDNRDNRDPPEPTDNREALANRAEMLNHATSSHRAPPAPLAPLARWVQLDLLDKMDKTALLDNRDRPVSPGNPADRDQLEIMEPRATPVTPVHRARLALLERLRFRLPGQLDLPDLPDSLDETVVPDNRPAPEPSDLQDLPARLVSPETRDQTVDLEDPVTPVRAVMTPNTARARIAAVPPLFSNQLRTTSSRAVIM